MLIKNQQGRCMNTQPTNSYKEHCIFWCPPLFKKVKKLTSIWHQFSDNMQQAQAETFITLASRKLAVTEFQRAENFLQLWPKLKVSCFNEFRPADFIPTNYILVIIDKHVSSTTLLEMLMFAQAKSLSCHKSIPILLISDCNGGQIPNLEPLKRIKHKLQVTVTTLLEPSHHAILLENAHSVVVFNSWLGFEALLWHKPVSVFGAPFYARLGLTEDVKLTALSGNVSLQQLVYFILLEYSYSICPETGNEIPLEQALAWLHQQLAIRQRFAKDLYAIGFSAFWRPIVKQFLQGSKITFVKNAQDVPANSTAVCWGNRPIANLAANCNVIRLEDGFLRSVGLGALFIKPLSWVVDTRGIYFNAEQESDLEHILNNYHFTEQDLEQAKALRVKLIKQQLTKYNTGRLSWEKPATTRKIILVVGQVETDASLTHGATTIKRNIDLLKTVRKANLTDYIIYKPHPDVIAKARAKGQDEELANQYCDDIITDTNIGAMLPLVDEVHVITSLAGFEALLRDKKVVCYGMPFYAGWGLTTDSSACSRRTKKLKLEELIAGVLLMYPLYLSNQSGYYTSASQTADTLSHQQSESTRFNFHYGKWLRKLVNALFGAK